MGPVLRAVDPGGTEADEDRALWDSFSGGHQGYKGPSQKHPNGQQEKCTYRLPSTQHEFNEICHSVTFYFMKKDSKRRCDTTTPESIHTKDESKRGSAFAFIFGVN